MPELHRWPEKSEAHMPYLSRLSKLSGKYAVTHIAAMLQNAVQVHFDIAIDLFDNAQAFACGRLRQ